jgi:hypothetical protein
MTTVTIEDMPVSQELSRDAAKKIVGGMIRQPKEEPVSVPDPTGGAGYTGIMIHWKLTVIE